MKITDPILNSIFFKANPYRAKVQEAATSAQEKQRIIAVQQKAEKKSEFTPKQKHRIIKDFDLWVDTKDYNLLMQNDRAFNQFYEMKDYEMSMHSIYSYAYLSAEEFEKAKELIKIGMVPARAHIAAKFSEEQFERAKYLARKKIAFEDIEILVRLNKKQYDRAIKLLKTKMPLSQVAHIACLDDETYSMALEAIKKGVDYDLGLYRLINAKSDNTVTIAKMHQGLNYRSAQGDITKRQADFLEMGYSEQTSAILEDCIPIRRTVTKETMDSIDRIERFVRKNAIKSRNYIGELSSFMSKMLQNKSIEKFDEYISQIDIDKIKKIAPHMIRYTSSELLSFLNWHYAHGTEEFSENTLNIDLTNYLEKHPINKKQLWHLLNAHPLARREVGQVPNDWLNCVLDEEKATQEIYAAIKKFQGKKDTQELSQNLTKILNKKVKVEELGQGLAGIVYKIEMQYAKPTCLKLFHIYRKSNFTPPEIHGVNFEPQIGLFLNENSNDYVHMFFGKVASGDNKDGFIVTQFLDKTTIPIKAYNSQRYYIEQTDRKSANKINDIYVDYGGVIVKRR